MHGDWRARYLARQELFRAKQLRRLKGGIRNAVIVTVVALFAMLALSWPPIVLLAAAGGWLFAAVQGYLFSKLRRQPLDRIGLLAAATLPSGDVLVFDQDGHAVDELCGTLDLLKEEVLTQLGPSGRFFTIDGSTAHYWDETGTDSGYGTPRLEVTLRAVQNGAAEWAARTTSGHQVAQATWRPDAANWSPARDDIWLLIREAALRPSLARGEAESATHDPGGRVAPRVFAANPGDHTKNLPGDATHAMGPEEAPARRPAILTTVTGWSIVGTRPDCYETGLASAMFEGHPVTYFRSVTDPTLGFGALQQDASAQKFTSRRLSFGGAVRAEGVTGWASLWLRLDGPESGRPLAYESMRKNPLTGSTDWGRFLVAVDVPPDATNIAYGVALHGQGTIWLADLGLRLLDDGLSDDSARPIEMPDPALAPLRAPSASAVRLAGSREPFSPKLRSVSGFEVWPASECPTFAQVGGMQGVKEQLARTVGLVLTDPARAAQLKVAFNGVLLYGPLGTGKSLFARALAGEYRCNLVLAIAGQLQGAPQEMAERLDDAFEVARSSAPAVLFFDEFDWLVTQPDRRPLLEGLLDRLYRELQSGADAPRVVVVAATQAIDAIDPSAIRPGLFDLKIRVGLPDLAARVAILETQLRDRPTDPSVDVSALAARTEGLTAAALSAVVNAAAMTALGRKSASVNTISQEDLLEAIRERGGRDRPALAEWTWDALILPAHTKRELQELQRMIEDPRQAQRFGIAPPRGALLYGPPGTGKTTIARVLAAQAKTSFYPIKGSDIISKWLGESEQRVHELFERARENRPSIVFVDEIDALGAARGSGDSGAMDRILNQLLQEIDGLQSGAGVFVLGATNRRDLLDEALIRGGRLGRQIEIPSPDVEGRVALLKSFTKAMPLTTALDCEDLARRTEGMSGADLQQLCQQAAIHAMMRSTSDAAEVAVDDFAAALGEARARTTRSRV